MYQWVSTSFDILLKLNIVISKTNVINVYAIERRGPTRNILIERPTKPRKEVKKIEYITPTLKPNDFIKPEDALDDA